MYLKNISISGFKNISDGDINFASKINCITGINGAGKTNLLEAVYYLSMTKGYSSQSDCNAINRDSDSSTIHATYRRDEEVSDTILLYMDRGGSKIVKKNGKKYARLSDHVGTIPIVMVSPYDTCLINESGEERRKYMNFILSQLDREYLRRIQNYNHLLMQRNKLLKSDNLNKDLLYTLNFQMEENAGYIYSSRNEFSRKVLPLVSKYYNALSGGKEEVSIEYRSDLQRGTLSSLLADNEGKDRLLGFTSRGVQRDDLVFIMDGFKFKVGGSQGQQKSFLISLKLAQFEIIRELTGKYPLLLLDDVFDKLDINRVSSLLNMVSESTFGQIFITDSNKVRISDILASVSGESALLEVKEGVINRI
jgi:DNA replication and repair protein RecF